MDDLALYGGSAAVSLVVLGTGLLLARRAGSVATVPRASEHAPT